ncbi:MAG: hypothetical protein J5808_06215 [Paludibacteraceae bacterium]|nr:hypothetical protein [Paludibacteraceae bacterium]
MIFKFLLVSDEVEGFMREISIDSEAKFSDLQQAILDSVNYSNDVITSFFVCNDKWEKEQEITVMEMDTSSDIDNYVMDETTISELVSEEGQKLMFVFDMLAERAFFIELKEIVTGSDLDAPVCTFEKGEPPLQSSEIDSIEDLTKGVGNNSAPLDMDELYESDNYDIEELDTEGFSELTFDDEF